MLSTILIVLLLLMLLGSVGRCPRGVTAEAGAMAERRTGFDCVDSGRPAAVRTPVSPWRWYLPRGDGLRRNRIPDIHEPSPAFF